MTPPIKMIIPRDEPGNFEAINDPARIEGNDGDLLDVEGDWWIRNFPPGSGITNLPADANCFLQQTLDVYFSAFFLNAAPADFTALPDA